MILDRVELSTNGILVMKHDVTKSDVRDSPPPSVETHKWVGVPFLPLDLFCHTKHLGPSEPPGSS